MEVWDCGRELRDVLASSGLSVRGLARRIPVDPGHLSRVLNGRRPLSLDLAKGCDRVLGTGGRLARVAIEAQQSAGFQAREELPLPEDLDVLVPVVVNGRSQLMPLDRRTLLLGMTAGAVTSAVGTPWSVSRHVAPEVPAQLLDLRTSLVNSDSLLGPARLIAAVAEQTAHVRELLDLAKGRTRDDLFAVASLYAEFQGWLQGDVGALQRGRAWTGRALEWAEAAGDPGLTGYMLMRRAQEAVAAGDGALAVGLARAAVARGESAPFVHAAGLQQLAHGLAMAGEDVAALRALDDAWALVEVGGDFGAYSLASWCTALYVTAQRAAVLSRLGRHRDAAEAYDLALASWPADYRRERGLHLARKSLALAQAHDLDGAVDAGREALAIAVQTGSYRTVGELAPLTGHLTAVTKSEDAVELVQLIAAATKEAPAR